MQAGTARIDITPAYPVWMDGMIRSHKSTGVRHNLYVKSLALSSGTRPEDVFVIASVDVCYITRRDHDLICADITGRTGIPPENLVIASIHNHSGPAVIGRFTPREEEYLADLRKKITECVCQASGNMRPAMAGCGSGAERTISHYRRLIGLANGQVSYVPTVEAVRQGGYEPSQRRVDESAGEIVFQQSVDLLKRMHA